MQPAEPPAAPEPSPLDRDALDRDALDRVVGKLPWNLLGKVAMASPALRDACLARARGEGRARLVTDLRAFTSPDEVSWALACMRAEAQGRPFCLITRRCVTAALCDTRRTDLLERALEEGCFDARTHYSRAAREGNVRALDWAVSRGLLGDHESLDRVSMTAKHFEQHEVTVWVQSMQAGTQRLSRDARRRLRF